MDEKKTPRTPFPGTRLYREVTYLHEDEHLALVERAEAERCSKAEVMRRALRGYLEAKENTSQSLSSEI